MKFESKKNSDSMSTPLNLEFPDKGSTQITPDTFLSRIGNGKYQNRALFIVGLLVVNDGAEVLVLSFLLSILQKEWNLTNSEIGLMGSTNFIGFLIGSIISGRISDKLGRRKPLLYVFFLLYFFAMWSAFAESFFTLLVVRTAFRFFEAFRYNLVITYLTEISPKESRGMILYLSGAFWIVGELFASFATFFTLDSADQGNWRLLLIIVAQPAFF
jgi:Permeases of the major facilitator superfamily